MIGSVIDDHGTRLTLSGELDLQTAPELDLYLESILRAPSTRTLLDLTHIEFMDSAGLGVIIRQHQQAQLSGHRLVLRPGHGQVRRLLELTGLNEELTFEDS
jgi:anti-sigma B factor antagonist